MEENNTTRYCLGRSSTGKKSVPVHSFPEKARGHTMCWQWAVGGWRRLVVGDWWLMAVGSGWRLAVGHRWRFVAVGSWWRLVVGG